ncbi:MAG: hypothetical protein EBS07_11380 [Sphingobacteriia bacterium]|nr:hypothetical protein [Sphingobacteriia bacterium]
MKKGILVLGIGSWILGLTTQATPPLQRYRITPHSQAPVQKVREVIQDLANRQGISGVTVDSSQTPWVISIQTQIGITSSDLINICSGKKVKVIVTHP